MSSSRRHFLTIALALAVFAGVAAPARAQTNGQASRPNAASPVTPWTIEGYGGFALGRITTGGSSSLPGAGAPITTSSPIFPSWQVPSWFFGDGAAFLNNVNEEFSLTQRITPLDSALTRPGLAGTGAPFVGVRLRRVMASRYALEISVDMAASSARISGDLDAAAEASRASFESAFAALLATGPFTGIAVSATSAVAAGSGRELTMTAAAEYEYPPIRRFTPYVVAGGGVIVQAGDMSALTLTGNYRFTIAGTAGPLAVAFNETDEVTLSHRQGAALVGIVGGGIRRDVSDRWGVQIDARVFVGQDTTTLLIDANPSRVTATPAGFIETFTFPNLQFSNNASTGRQSTLSGSLQGFEALSGRIQTRVRLTIGLFMRF